jgi:hypothetical protein
MRPSALNIGVLVPSVLALLLAHPPAHAATEQPVSKTNPQIQCFYDQAKEAVARGDLVNARRAAVQAWGSAGIKARFPADGEPPYYSYLFPEGEALRFYYRDRGTVLLYIELSEGKATLVWQAKLKQGGGNSLGKKDTISRYLSEYSVEATAGTRPTLDTPLIYFTLFPTVGSMAFGSITRDGKQIDRGALHVTAEDVEKNKLILEIPGEKAAGPAR